MITLITGANGGIGSGIVEHFLKKGDRLIACQYRRRHDTLKALFERYDLPFEKHCFYADMCDEDDVKALKRSINTGLGGVTTLLNVVGSSSNGMFWKLSKDEFEKTVLNNLTPAFLAGKIFLDDMLANGSGRIINFSSVVAFKGAIGASHYGAGKGGLVSLTKCMALELAEKNITVNALALGYFDRGMILTIPEKIRETIKQQIPLKRFGGIGEVCGMIEYLIGDDGKYTTGQSLHINGGAW